MDRDMWEGYARYCEGPMARKVLDVGAFLLFFFGILLAALAVTVVMQPIEESFLSGGEVRVGAPGESPLCSEGDICRLNVRLPLPEEEPAP